jgi:hypothetical protein
MTITPTLRAPLPWLALLQLGDEDAARASIVAGFDPNAALARLSEPDLVELALKKGALDTEKLLGCAAECAIEAAVRDRIGEGIASRLDQALNDRFEIAKLVVDARAALANGECTTALVWAIDAISVWHIGKSKPATFAAVTAIREACAKGELAGRAARWEWFTLPVEPDPHTLIRAIVEDPFATGANWIGCIVADGVSQNAARAALVRVLEDRYPEIAPLREGEDFPIATTRAEEGLVQWYRVHGLDKPRVWIDAGFVAVTTSPEVVMWSLSNGPRRSDHTWRVGMEAVEIALEAEVRDTPWAPAFAELMKVYPDRRAALARHGNEEGVGRVGQWTIALRGDPAKLAAQLRAMRR